MSLLPLVLNVPRNDKEGRDALILLQISDDGPSLLDVKLVATDGVTPFVGSIRQKDASKLRSKNYTGTESEWLDILKYLLLRDSVDKYDDRRKGQRLIASVREEVDIVLFIEDLEAGEQRKLGSVVLKADESYEIELFDWTLRANDAFAAAKEEITSLTLRNTAQNRTNEKLKEQLDDLILAKKQDDEELLLKFRDLLNSKKLKIRDQQRLLNKAKISPEEAATARATRVSTSRRSAVSGTRKRKANEDGSPSTDGKFASSSEDGGDEAFERTGEAVDSDASIPIGKVETPERTEEETESEEDEDIPLSSSRPPRTRQTRDTEHLAPIQEKAVEKPSRKPSPPPPRTLPFPVIRGNPRHEDETVAEGQKGQNKLEDTGSETEDDEL
ncbi:MAG: hypothetical protein M1825_005690 [Sarcosagium campestre]|nr:MAG: hypothetical protein M1825_005690 [Sarcosagium campestre]